MRLQIDRIILSKSPARTDLIYEHRSNIYEHRSNIYEHDDIKSSDLNERIVNTFSNWYFFNQSI